VGAVDRDPGGARENHVEVALELVARDRGVAGRGG
jgi:hypothetical protein